MAPSPAAGSKGPVNPPKTPTKAGKNPASSATSKLGQSQSVADSPKNTAKSATNTPKSAPKGAADKPKGSTSGKPDTSSPSLPPRPKDAGGIASKPKGPIPKASKPEEAVADVGDKGEEAKGKVEDVKDDAEDTKEDTGSRIDLKDNDPADEADNEETDTPVGKVSQRGNETGAEEESSADDLDDAAPEPIDDEDEATAGAEDTPEETDVPGTDDAQGKADDVAKGAQDKAGGATDKADDVAKGAKGKAGAATDKADDVTKGAKGKGGGVAGKSKGLAGGAKGKIGGALGGLAGSASSAKDTAGKAAEGDVSGAGEDAKGGLEDTAGEAKEGAEDIAEDAKGGVEDVADDAQEDVEEAKDGLEDAADDVEEDVEDAKGAAEDGAPDGVKDAVGDAKDAAPDVEGVGDTVDDAKDTAEDAAPDVDEVEDAVDDAKDTVEDAAPDVDGAEDAVDDVKDIAEDAAPDVDGAEDAVDDVKDTAEDAAPDVDGVEDAVDDVKDTVEDAADQVPVDLSVLKGLEVGEGGEILGPDGEPLGQLDEGDPEDLVGKTIGDDGEILDEDGDVIGRASVLPDKAKELADQAKDDLPDIAVLDGLEVGEDGNILGADGTPLGKIVDGDPKDLVGLKLNEKGEIVDEDGDIIGRAEVVPGEAVDKVDEIEDALPEVNVLEGLKVGEGGQILDDDDKPLGQIDEGELEDLIGQEINEKGQILDEEDNIIGTAKVVPGEAADKLNEAKEDVDIDELHDELSPDFSILDGKKINKKGNILDDEGEIIGKLTEDSDLKQCVGKKPNENGEILNDDGEVVGKVEIVAGDAADEAMKDLHPEIVEKLEKAVEAAEAAEAAAAEAAKPDLSILDGLKVNKKGEVLDEEGEPIGRVAEGEIKDLAGKKINDKGEVLDKEGNVIGRVEVIPREVEAAVEDAEGAAEDAEGAAEDAEEAAEDAEGAAEDAEGAAENAEGAIEDAKSILPDLSILDGLKVNKKGEVVNEDGDPIARVSEGEVSDLTGKKINDKGEVIDSEGNVIGKVELIPQEPEVEDAGPELPPLSILEGLKCNKSGKIINADGKPVGELIEGDPKKLSVEGVECDAEGQFWDSKGHVIGRAQTLPEDDDEAEATFAGLEGLIVVKDGFVEDINENKVGIITEGDPKKLVGRAVDEDGDVLDKRGNVVGHAERYEEPGEDTGPERPPLSILEGLKCNKSGKIINADGKPVGELVEGDPKKLSVEGVECDAEGQFWDSKGHVIGRAQTLPEDDDEAEATFAGLEGLIVVKDGFVEDINENKVGIITEGDPKKLVGRAVDEDGDVLDKRGNVVGHAERYEEPEEDTGPERPPLSILEGLTCNKSGKIIDADGKTVGELIEGDPKRISKSGALCDAEGQFWDSKGQVIGRAQTLPKVDDEEEATFAGLEGLIVVKDGFVEDINENKVGIITEGDPKKLVGRAVDEDGDVLDKRGSVVGHAERYEEPEDTGPVHPPLSILEGLKCNKSGKIVNADGKPVGELIEGDPKKIAKSGAQCDAEGQFWDSKGNVVGRAQTLLQDDDEEEATFAGLEGLVVVKDGFVEDINENKVGIITEGDPKKLVGRTVDEDGDVLDKRGNVVGHAERYEEPEPEEEPEEEKPDLSILKGLLVNKQGNVIGIDGLPIARVVEGNIDELSGRRCDGEGQVWNDSGSVIGRVELIPDKDRQVKLEGSFAGIEGLVVVKDGWVEDRDGNIVGKVVEGDPKKLVGRAVDEDGDIIDKYGNVKGRAEPYEEPEVEEEKVDLSSLEGKVVNKAGNVVDEHGTIYGRVVSGDTLKLAGRKVDGEGQIWSDNGKVIGQAELIPGGDRGKADGPFAGFEGLVVVKDGLVHDAAGQVVGKLAEGSDPVKLLGRKVDEDGDILDSSGNSIGKAERYTPEEKERKISPMSGRKVNKEGEVRDEDGNVIGKLTEGDLASLIGCEIDDNGYVIDNDGNRIGQCTLLENIKEEEPEPEEEPEEGPSEEELAAMKKAEEDNELAKKMNAILKQTLDRIEPVCKQITERIEVADRTPKDELDEEQLVQDLKPLIEEGGRILQECNGAIRGLDPDGRIAANAKARAANREATPEEYALADSLKELTTTVVKTIDNAKKKIADMPHAKKALNPLWGLLTEPLFQIIAAVGLLLAGVLGLVGKLLNGLGLGGLVNGLLGGLGIDKLLGGLGLGSITEALGFGGGKKKKK
ncbi:hypothetical protein MMC29_005364 [Sticta canariensis]|nr:hypothetical protein [Sticta canariensis]